MSPLSMDLPFVAPTKSPQTADSAIDWSCSIAVIDESSITLQFTGDKPRAKQWICHPSEFGRYLALVMRSQFRTLWRHF